MMLYLCVPAVKLEEVFKICHKGVAGGHRGVAATLDKFQRTFVVMSAREKICRLVDGSNTCLVKERSIQAKRGPHMPSTVGNVGETLFIDLVSMSETVRKNRYLLTVQDGVVSALNPMAIMLYRTVSLLLWSGIKICCTVPAVCLV